MSWKLRNAPQYQEEIEVTDRGASFRYRRGSLSAIANAAYRDAIGYRPPMRWESVMCSWGRKR